MGFPDIFPSLLREDEELALLQLRGSGGRLGWMVWETFSGGDRIGGIKVTIKVGGATRCGCSSSSGSSSSSRSSSSSSISSACSSAIPSPNSSG